MPLLWRPTRSFVANGATSSSPSLGRLVVGKTSCVEGGVADRDVSPDGATFGADAEGTGMPGRAEVEGAVVNEAAACWYVTSGTERRCRVGSVAEVEGRLRTLGFGGTVTTGSRRL